MNEEYVVEAEWPDALSHKIIVAVASVKYFAERMA